MLDLAHFGDEIGQLDELRMRVAPRADHVDTLGPRRKRCDHFLRIQHFIAYYVIDLIENYEIILLTANLRAAEFPGLFAEADVLGIGLRAANFHKAAAHRANFEFVITQHLCRVELAIVPRAFDELHHQDAHALADGAKPGPERAGRLALAGPGVNDQESFTFRH